MDAKTIIDRLGGPGKVAELCEVFPQAVYQWYGVGPDGKERHIPRARLLYLKAIKPDAFKEEARPKRKQKARAT